MATEQKGGVDPEWTDCLGQSDAAELDNALFFDYEYSIDQLMEVAGLCVAQSIARSYPLSNSSRILLVCGPGNNGGDGLAAARHLHFFGYQPTIFYPKHTSKEIYQILVNQCEKLRLPFLSSLPPPAQIDSEFQVVVDAIFGFSFKGTSVRSPFDQVLSSLRQINVPIASIDIPSGWDVEKGDINGFGLNPDLLISLTAPKLCSKYFKGQYHFLGLRMIPQELANKYRLKLPQYPSTDQIVQLK